MFHIKHTEANDFRSSNVKIEEKSLRMTLVEAASAIFESTSPPRKNLTTTNDDWEIVDGVNQLTIDENSKNQLLGSNISEEWNMIDKTIDESLDSLKDWLIVDNNTEQIRRDNSNEYSNIDPVNNNLYADVYEDCKKSTCTLETLDMAKKVSAILNKFHALMNEGDFRHYFVRIILDFNNKSEWLDFNVFPLTRDVRQIYCAIDFPNKLF